MPSPQTSPLVPRNHCLCGRGLLSILLDLEPGVGLAFWSLENMTSLKRLTHFQWVEQYIRKT